MNPGRSILFVAVFVAGGTLAVMPFNGSARSADSKPRPKQNQAKHKPKPGSEAAIRIFMRQKLKSMRLVMQGIVTEDYALIRKNAAAMKKMGTGAEWNVVQGPIYGSHRDAFERSAGLLEQAAKDKNGDGALLIYMQMTLNCIECHRYTREPKVRKKYMLD